MFSLFKIITVKPNHIGFLYKDYRFHKRLQPGLYQYFAGFTDFIAVILPTTDHFLTVTNQEVLTKDYIALRFSYFLRYAVIDYDRFIARFNVFDQPYNLFFDAEQIIHQLSQAHLREAISQVNSEALHEQRAQLSAIPEDLQHQLAEYGLELLELTLRDITFPKSIQELFARRLEAKIRAQSDLENARTAVATARTLKNASELMKGDDNIRYLQLLETLIKISATGKHTFVLGELIPTISRPTTP